MDYKFDFGAFVWIFFICFLGFLTLGVWNLIDWLFIEDVIKSSKPINPEIKLIIKNNTVDTIYIYHKP